MLGEVRALFDSATTNQQRLLRVLGSGQSAYTGLLLRRVGMDQGSVGRTVGQLVRHGCFEEFAGGHRIIDPMLTDWLGREFPP